MASNIARYLTRATGLRRTALDDHEKHRRTLPSAPPKDTTDHKQIGSGSTMSPEQPHSAPRVVVEVPDSFEAIVRHEDETRRPRTSHREQLGHGTHQNLQLKQEPKEAVHVIKSDKKNLLDIIKSRNKKIQILENNNADLQRERQQYMHESNVEQSTIKQQLRKRNQQLEEAQSENKLLKASLEECKDRIFSMQPTQGMSDTQLQASYTDLCKSIEYWIEEQFDEVKDVIMRVITADNGRDGPHVVLGHIAQAHIEAIIQEPELDSALLVGLVSRYLHHQFLSSDRVFPGLPEATESCLREINTGINNLSPSKDMESIQSWRVDLYKTLSSLESAKQARECALRVAATTIRSSFMSVRSMDVDTRPGAGTCDRIVADAADLAGNVRQTIAMYEFDPDPWASAQVEIGVLKLEDWKKYKIIDSRTGQAVRSSAIPTADGNGRVGEILFVVHPAFVRKPTKTAAAIILVKPTIAVKFDHAIPRGGKRNRFG
ncbi:hypothetical protein LTR10_021471 [Elasticomyces elasticus]|uniref:Uncharacterized protein n=1 Tax=Exophiala sideris TaxID=1016849 RepID=A0ABR0J9K0_9EURO|nr:hypothetical protein LTR10_021471 [Elasticomyces elasticus]KAK5027823.1 hypothetical protein LTS07_006698 [Exophiala sideris]KAK5037589.1 hypothetical protein LTR13_004747 [Exophiala sideris]KAK5059250.1 hypothetical protein LTR69_006540 [Exophiala sideris]KAK5183084.1 hypothetical protein LTR44_004795 [Eurotiomycetes sp. CCFEE 6388]